MKALAHFARFVVGFDGPHSQVSDLELCRLTALAAHSNTVVEIGCYEGRTAVSLAGSTAGQVHSIDPFWPGRLGICYAEWIARLHRRRKGVTNLTFHKALGHIFAQSFLDSSVDLVFIDGDHSWAGLERDWESWLPKVRPGGWLALHDCLPGAGSTTRLGSMDYYAERLVKDRRALEVDRAGSLVVFERTLADSA